MNSTSRQGAHEHYIIFRHDPVVFHHDMVIDDSAYGLIENELCLAGFRNLLANIRDTQPGFGKYNIRCLANRIRDSSKKADSHALRLSPVTETLPERMAKAVPKERLAQELNVSSCDQVYQ